MKFKLIILLIMGFVLFPILCMSGEVYDYITYYGYTEEPLTFAWDPDPNATYYEIKLRHIEQDIDVVIGQTTHPTSQITIYYPRSGHYINMVKACNEAECSDWSESTGENAAYNGQSRTWWVYRYISPPGDIGIE